MEARESIRELGGDLVVFYTAPPALVDDWRRDAKGFPDDVDVLVDPGALVYRALGTKRVDPVSLLVRSLRSGIRAAREGHLPHLTSADMLRMGADVAVRPDGEIAKLHLASTPDDRIGVEELVAALR